MTGKKERKRSGGGSECRAFSPISDGGVAALTLRPSLRWSTREEYAQQHYARRPSSLFSFGDAVTTTVEVTESRSHVSSISGKQLPAQTVSIESRRASANSAEEEEVPPPVPPKDRPTLRV